MANLTRDRKSDPNLSYLNMAYFGPFKLAANQVIYAGCMYALNALGRPINPGATTDIVAGVASEQMSNTAGAPWYKSGLDDDAKSQVNLYSGVFSMDPHGTHPPTIADLWKPAYASDNHTISRLATDGSRAGVIVWVDATHVYVYFAPFATAHAALTENGVAIGGTNNGDLPDLTATYVARTGTPGTADGAMQTVGATNGSDVSAAINNNFQEVLAVLAQLAADNIALRAAIREVANVA